MWCGMEDHTKFLKKIDFCHFYRGVLSLGWEGYGGTAVKTLELFILDGSNMTHSDPG